MGNRVVARGNRVVARGNRVVARGNRVRNVVAIGNLCGVVDVVVCDGDSWSEKNNKIENSY